MSADGFDPLAMTEAEFGEFVARIIRRIDIRAAAAIQAEDEAKRAKARADAFRAKNENSRSLLLSLLERAERTAIKTPAGVARIRPTPPKVIITGSVPPRFLRLKSEPDKAAIKEALTKDGEVLDFAEMSNGGATLEIRK